MQRRATRVRADVEHRDGVKAAAKCKRFCLFIWAGCFVVMGGMAVGSFWCSVFSFGLISPCQVTGGKCVVMLTQQEKENVDVAMGLTMNLKVRNEQQRRSRKKEQQTDEQKERKKAATKNVHLPPPHDTLLHAKDNLEHMSRDRSGQVAKQAMMDSVSTSAKVHLFI